MQYTYHLFGDSSSGKPSLICPESVALFWLLNSDVVVADALEQSVIVYSNNTDMSPIKALPLLIVSKDCVPSLHFAGLFDIILFLIRNNLIKGGPAASIDFLAALHFLSHDFKYMTLYQLYLNKANYAEFTRKQFSKLLYWPAWYTTPISIRSNVRDICSHSLQLEYLPVDEDELLQDDASQQGEVGTLESELAQSKILKLSQWTNRNKLEDLKTVKHHLQYCTKLCELLDNWQSLQNDCELESCLCKMLEICLITNLYIQLTLPKGDNILEYLKQNKGEKWVSSLTHKINLYSNTTNVITVREPIFTEQGNVVMSMYHKLKYYSGNN